MIGHKDVVRARADTYCKNDTIFSTLTVRFGFSYSGPYKVYCTLLYSEETVVETRDAPVMLPSNPSVACHIRVSVTFDWQLCILRFLNLNGHMGEPVPKLSMIRARFFSYLSQERLVASRTLDKHQLDSLNGQILSAMVCENWLAR